MLNDRIKVHRFALRGRREREGRLPNLERSPARQGGDAQLERLEGQVLALHKHRSDDDVGRTLAVGVQSGQVLRGLRHETMQYEQMRLHRQLGRQVLQLIARHRQRHALALRRACGQILLHIGCI